MDIVLEGIGKRFRYEWIFRDINFTFQQGKVYGLQGPNGSGKSTFLKILSSHLSPSAGSINYFLDKASIPREKIYNQVGFTGPYIELIEEFTLTEAIEFHRKFKPLIENWTATEFIELVGLPSSKDKEIANFSSGMKQRLKLALTICSQSKFLLLDEPNTNLDGQAAAWFQDLLQKYRRGRTVVIASNEERDFELCEELVNLKDWKK